MFSRHVPGRTNLLTAQALASAGLVFFIRILWKKRHLAVENPPVTHGFP